MLKKVLCFWRAIDDCRDVSQNKPDSESKAFGKSLCLIVTFWGLWGRSEQQRQLETAQKHVTALLSGYQCKTDGQSIDFRAARNRKHSPMRARLGRACPQVPGMPGVGRPGLPGGKTPGWTRCVFALHVRLPGLTRQRAR